MSNTDIITYRGVLTGHGPTSITAISTPSTSSNPSYIISSSRDKTVMLWKLFIGTDNYVPGEPVGMAQRALTGHGQAVSDVVMSSDGHFALSGSWDKTLRLWDLQRCETVRKFIGHTNSVLSVAFSADNRQIVSAGMDKVIKLWNTLAECKYNITQNQHKDWVNCVRFSPSKQSLIVSCSRDSLVKVWNLASCTLRTDLTGHTKEVRSVTVSPDGSLCASGGMDGVVKLWDVNEGRHLYVLSPNSPINTLCFSPTNYWLCAVTAESIKIWDLENKHVLAEIKASSVSSKFSDIFKCTSLTWSGDGRFLFLGSADGKILVYEVTKNDNIQPSSPTAQIIK